MVAGLTGSMKTLWMLDLIKRMGVRTEYFSNDSDETTVASRLLAAAVQRPVEQVAAELKGEPAWASSLLAQHDNIRWCFDPSPTLEDIGEETEAFGEIYGDYPELIVVDILRNVAYYEDAERGSNARKLQYFHSLARQTGAGIIVVHHCTEASRADPCPSRSDILEKQNELPSLILTVGVRGNAFHVAPVKNRHGFQDPSGYTNPRLRVDPETCQFWEA
jgi:hypothetical protein